MLAGVIVPLGLKPVLATAATPSLMWPILLAWLIVLALASRWRPRPPSPPRWRTALTTGIFYLGLAAAAGVVAAIVLAEPGGLLPAAAGLALVGTLAGSIQQSLEDIPGRLRAAVTLRVAASGITVLGIGGAFWALLVGVLLRLLLVRKPRAVA